MLVSTAVIDGNANYINITVLICLYNLHIVSYIVLYCINQSALHYWSANLQSLSLPISTANFATLNLQHI